MHWSKAPTWTDADHELLNELLTRQKLSYWRAARRMKRGIDSVRREAYKLGIRSPYATGAASGRPWTIEEETRLIRLREAKRSWEDTAAAMGRTVKACKERISHKLAGQMADRLLKPVTRTLHPRLCLGPLCKNKADRTFQSTGIENRICNSCKIAMHNLHEGMV